MTVSFTEAMESFTPDVMARGTLIIDSASTYEVRYCAIGWFLHLNGISDDAIFRLSETGCGPADAFLARYGLDYDGKVVAEICARNDGYGPWKLLTRQGRIDSLREYARLHTI